MHENTGQKGMRKRPGRGETRVCLVLVGLEVPQPHLPIKIEFEDCRPIALLEEGSGSPPLSVGDVYQDPPWMPETADRTEPNIYNVFSYMHL